MKWFMIIIFAEWEPIPAHIFPSPSFNSLDHCIEEVSDLSNIPKYAKEIYDEYDMPLTMESIGCLSEDDLRELNDMLKGEKI